MKADTIPDHLCQDVAHMAQYQNISVGWYVPMICII